MFNDLSNSNKFKRCW